MRVHVIRATLSLRLAHFLPRSESSSAGGFHESGASLNSRLFRRVIQEELRDAASVEVPPLTPLNVKTDQDRKVVCQLAKMIRIIGDRVKDDPELRE